MRRRGQNKKRSGIGTIVIVVLLICGIVSYNRISLDSMNVQSENRRSEAKAALLEEQERSQEIEELKAYVQTKKYMEEIAREKLGLVYEDEIIFKSED